MVSKDKDTTHTFVVYYIDTTRICGLLYRYALWTTDYGLRIN